MDHEVGLSLRLTFTIAAAAIMLIITVGITAFFQGNEERGMNALLEKQKKEAYDYLEDMDGLTVSGAVANSLIREFKGQTFGFWLEGSYHYYVLNPAPNDRYTLDAAPISNCRFGDHAAGVALCNQADYTAVYDCVVLYGENNQPIGVRFNRR